MYYVVDVILTKVQFAQSKVSMHSVTSSSSYSVFPILRVLATQGWSIIAFEDDKSNSKMEKPHI